MSEGDEMADVEERIRAVLVAHARMPGGVEALDDTADLYAAGMTSHASVNVMLAIEDEFDVEFPERLLRKDTFASVSAIRAALEELLGG